MLAGYETTANALAFSMYNVGRFPEVEKRILEEVDSFGRNKEPSYHDIQQAHTLTALGVGDRPFAVTLSNQWLSQAWSAMLGQALAPLTSCKANKSLCCPWDSGPFQVHRGYCQRGTEDVPSRNCHGCPHPRGGHSAG